MDHERFLQETLPAMDMVHAIARRAVRHAQDAEDLVQDTYLAAYRAWVDDRRPDRVEPWLATICLNLVRSRYRAQQRHPDEIPLAAIPEEGTTRDDPQEHAMVTADADAVHLAMWSLPEEQRIAIALVDLADLSVLDAAAVMGTPKGTVLSRLHRGRRALAQRLAPDREEAR